MENRQLLMGAGMLALLVVLAVLFTAAVRALFIIFLAVLFGVFLYESGRRLSERFGMHRRVWILLILLLFFGGLTVVGLLSGDSVAEQFDQLGPSIMPALEDLEAQLSEYRWGRELLSAAQNVDVDRVLPRLEDTVGALTTGVVALVVVFVGGLFISMEPQPYRRGLLWLAPSGQERRYAAVYGDLQERLFRWTIGRLASMAVIFALTLVGLLIVGSPLAVLLALIAGLLSFIPNFGPIASASLAALVGLSVSPLTAAWIIVVFVAVQFLESNFVTPLIERRAVYLPAGFILLFQTFMGFVFGLLGLVVATPLAVAIIAIAKGFRKR